MKSLLGDILVGIGSAIVNKVIEFAIGKPKGPTAAELRDSLTVGGPTADARRRAEAEAAERWPAPAPVPRELVEEPIAGEPRREDLN